MDKNWITAIEAIIIYNTRNVSLWNYIEYWQISSLLQFHTSWFLRIGKGPIWCWFPYSLRSSGPISQPMHDVTEHNIEFSLGQTVPNRSKFSFSTSLYWIIHVEGGAGRWGRNRGSQLGLGRRNLPRFRESAIVPRNGTETHSFKCHSYVAAFSKGGWEENL